MSQIDESPTDDVRLQYFAYGSNMLRSRLEARVAGLRKESIAYLPDFRLRANKMGDDGSSKANIEPCKGERVWGVIWSLPVSEIEGLNSAEGYSPGRKNNHYEPQDVIVYDVDGEHREVMTYIACEDKTTEEDFPMYTWYHLFLIQGSEENSIPDDYIQVVYRLPRTDDRNGLRHRRNMTIVENRTTTDRQ